MTWGQLKDRAALPHPRTREGRAHSRWPLWLSAQSRTPQAGPAPALLGLLSPLRVHPPAVPLSLRSPVGTREKGQHRGGQRPLPGWEVSHKEASWRESPRAF